MNTSTTHWIATSLAQARWRHIMWSYPFPPGSSNRWPLLELSRGESLSYGWQGRVQEYSITTHKTATTYSPSTCAGPCYWLLPIWDVVNHHRKQIRPTSWIVRVRPFWIESGAREEVLMIDMIWNTGGRSIGLETVGERPKKRQWPPGA